MKIIFRRRASLLIYSRDLSQGKICTESVQFRQFAKRDKSTRGAY